MSQRWSLNQDLLKAAISQSGSNEANKIPFDLIFDPTNETYKVIPLEKQDFTHSTLADPYEEPENLIENLCKEYLEIPNQFPCNLLEKSQVYGQRPINIPNLIKISPTNRLSEFQIERDAFGTGIGFKEVCLASSNDLSMQLSRDFEAKSDREFWRGTSEGIPFVPGGMDVGQSISVPSQLLKEFLPQEEDALLTQFSQISLEPHANHENLLVAESKLSSKARLSRESELKSLEIKSNWAHPVDASKIPSDFSAVIPELAYKYPFELDTFQKQAVYYLEKGECVFVAAHTSAGKTVVAEYAIALAFKHMTKAIYTSPIKALSNQKYRDFKETFTDVGLLTGDVQISPEANCLIMTTEILRSMLYKGADLLRDVEFVIFDEVHYVNDADRGHVWEEVIIMLPSHVNLILLSATVPNVVEFADWVGRTKKRDVYVVSTLKRPVPLEHYLYFGSACTDFIKIVDQNKNFLDANYKEAARFLKGKDALPSAGKSHSNDKSKNAQGNSKPSNSQSASSWDKKTPKASKNTWIHLIGMLKKKNLLPVVMFTFSKKRCDEYSSALLALDLTTSSEKSSIHLFLKKSLARLGEDDASLPQIARLCSLLERGIAVHHSGILPILKESVEILFSNGLVKILFATETFAMGVNMPAKTVVFTGKRKHDGTSMRDLLPGEYTQMSGRAGRRGLDSTGMVILYCEELPVDSIMKHMILGNPTKLESQFKLTYSMIVNLLRVEALRVEDMMKKSFSENDSQKSKGNVQQSLKESEDALKNAEKLDCSICNQDISEFYTLNVRLISMSSAIHSYFINQPKNKVLTPGRIMIINNEFWRNCPAVYLRFIDQGRVRKIECIPLASQQQISILSNDALPFFHWPVISGSRNAKRDFKDASLVQIEVEQVLSATNFSVKIPFSILGIPSKGEIKSVAESALGLIQSNFQHMNPAALEIDYESHCKDLDIISLLRSRKALVQQFFTFTCITCKHHPEHYAKYHVQRTLGEKLAEIQHLLTDNSLFLLPEYNQRIEVLKQLEFIDKEQNVLLKGRVACEFNTIDELIATELIFENMFNDFDGAEIIALLSCFVFQEKSSAKQKDSHPKRVDLDKPIKTEDYAHIASETDSENLPGNLQKGKDLIIGVATRLALLQKEAGIASVSVESTLETLKWGMLPVVYEWANGLSFKAITETTEIAEGSIVRCIVRLDETAREVRNAARTIGDGQLLKKMEEASVAIKRDICFASSLYL